MAKKHLGIAMALFLLMRALPFAVSAQSGGVTKNTNTKSAPESKEVALTIEGKIYGGVFVFEGNTIRFNNMVFYNRPEDITVDGKPWKDVAKPFELDYTPDFGKAGILEKDGPRMFYVDVTEKQFSLRIENTLPGNHIAPFKVKLAMKNQLPHGNSAAYRPVPQKSHIQPMNDGAFYKALAAKQTELWDSGIKEHKLLFTGVIEGKGTFVFEGNTIRYRHETGKMPDMVKINGQRWARLKEPFELPFQVETESLQINKEEGGYPVTLTRIDDRTFEVSFDDRDPHGAYYSVAITPGAPRQSK